MLKASRWDANLCKHFFYNHIRQFQCRRSSNTTGLQQTEQSMSTFDSRLESIFECLSMFANVVTDLMPTPNAQEARVGEGGSLELA